MAKAKISSKDFLDLLDEQSDQPAPALGSFGRTPPSPTSEKPTTNGSLNSSPNGKQTVVNGSLNSSPNGKQTVVNADTKSLPQISKREANGSLNSSHDNERNGSQTVVQTVVRNENKAEPSIDKIMRLGAIERRILFSVVESCVVRGQLVSGPLKPDSLSRAAGTTKKTTKSSAQRLVKRGLLTRAGGQDGKGGWTIFSVTAATRNAVIEISKNYPNGSQTVVQTVVTTPSVTVVKQESKQESGLSSSSSFIDLENLKTTTTTTGEPELIANIPAQLSPDWRGLDISPLADVGFSQTHLIQIVRQGKLRPSEVQESVQFFAFDLKRNGKGSTLNGPPLNFFMGILRKGIPYAPPENYESPEDEARRNRVEVLRRLEEKRQAERAELEELEFRAWCAGLTPEKKRELVPWAKQDGSISQEAGLKDHFRQLKQAGKDRADTQEIGQLIEASLQSASESIA